MWFSHPLRHIKEEQIYTQVPKLTRWLFGAYTLYVRSHNCPTTIQFLFYPLYIQHLRSLESYVYMEHNNWDFLITFINIVHESWYFYINISLQEKCHLHFMKSEFWNLDVFNIKAFAIKWYSTLLELHVFSNILQTLTDRYTSFDWILFIKVGLFLP